MFSVMMNSSIENAEFFPTYLARSQALATTQFMPGGWVLPSGLAAIIDKFRIYVGSYEQVLAEHMFASLYRRFMPDADYSRYVNHLLYEPAGGIASLIGQSGPLAGWNHAVLAFCPECIAIDKTINEQSFFRRENMLPGLLFCARHRVELLTGCGKCNAEERKFMANPTMSCGCRYRSLAEGATLSEADVAVEIEVSDAVSRLLKPTYLPHLNRNLLGIVVRGALRNCGVIKGNVFDWSELEKIYSNPMWNHLISRTNLPVSRTSRQFARFISGKGCFRNPIHNVSALIIIFGSWGNFEEVVSNFDEDNYVEPSLRIVNSKNKEINRMNKKIAVERYVKKYGEYREKYPDETHDEILLRFPESIRKHYISRRKILSYGISLAPIRESDRMGSYYERLDLSFSLHVKNVKKYLQSFDCSYQISETVLLRGHRMSKVFRSIRDKLPLTEEALEECSENRGEFYARILKNKKSEGIFSGNI